MLYFWFLLGLCTGQVVIKTYLKMISQFEVLKAGHLQGFWLAITSTCDAVLMYLAAYFLFA